tara:strand:- start:77 stop:271 length:195 start_codon:yes stop_codon:yes gene_type:complete
MLHAHGMFTACAALPDAPAQVFDPSLELLVRAALEEVGAVAHLLLSELDLEDIGVRRQRRVLQR